MTEAMREKVSRMINEFLDKNPNVAGVNAQVEPDGTISINYFFQEAC